jgi:hypothetical protein
VRHVPAGLLLRFRIHVFSSKLLCLCPLAFAVGVGQNVGVVVAGPRLPAPLVNTPPPRVWRPMLASSAPRESTAPLQLPFRLMCAQIAQLGSGLAQKLATTPACAARAPRATTRPPLARTTSIFAHSVQPGGILAWLRRRILPTVRTALPASTQRHLLLQMSTRV